MSEKSPSLTKEDYKRCWEAACKEAVEWATLYKECRKQTLAQVEKIIDKLFPKCNCPSEDIVNPDCPNELMDGAWTTDLNKDLKEEIKNLKEVGK